MDFTHLIRRCVLTVAILHLSASLRAETLYFRPTADSQSGIVNHNWLSATNWYIPNSQNPGTYLPAGRFPDYNGFHDSAVLLGNALLPGTARVADLQITGPFDLSGGQLTCDTLEAGNGTAIPSSFGISAGSTTVVTVNSQMTVTGLFELAAGTTLDIPLGVIVDVKPFAAFFLTGTAILNNNGEIEMENATSLGGGGTIRNTGTISSTGMAFLNPPVMLDSSGILEAKTGTFVVNGNSAASGLGTNAFGWASSSGTITFRTLAGANIIATGLPLTASLSAVVSGPGLTALVSVQMNGGALSVGIIDPSSHLLDAGHAAILDDPDDAPLLPGLATIDGTSSIHVLSQGATASSLIITSLAMAATFTGTIDIDPGGTLSIGSSPPTLFSFDSQIGEPQFGLHFFGGTINNSGAATLSEFAAQMDGTAVFNNLPGATFKITDDYPLDNAVNDMPTHGTIVNAGTLEKSGGTAATGPRINPKVTNSGTVKADAGTFNFANGLVQTSGETDLFGGNLAGTLTLKGGALNGSGTTGPIINTAGVISLGALPGTLTVKGDFTQGPAGVLKIKLGGTTQSTQYDCLNVMGTPGGTAAHASIGGVVQAQLINGFTPSLHQMFDILSGHAPNKPAFNGVAVSGHFSSLVAPPDSALRFDNAPDSVKLEVIGLGPDPFALLAGAYTGLLETDPSLEPDTGTITMTLGKTGTFTGTVLAGGKHYPFKGKFASDGSFTGPITKSTFSLTIVLDVNDHTREITGTLTDTATGKTAQVTVSRSLFSAGNPTPLAGHYTVLLPAVQSQGIPQGEGYATLTVKNTGTLSAAGVFGDGTHFSVGSHLTGESDWLFFAAPYPTGGSVSGDLTFRDVAAQSDLDGTLNWYRDVPAKVKSTTPWPLGFTTTINAVGSLYIPPAKGVRAITLPNKTGNATLTVTGGNFNPTPGPFTLNFLPTDQITAPATPKFSMHLTPSTGAFHGTFPNPANTKLNVAYTGVLFQKLDANTFGSGGGLCLGPRPMGSATTPTAALSLRANP